MSSLGQMVAGIAHEINNPVNFIYVQIAIKDNGRC
jgi:C4-dicarboxylate-specific signal transduction histidine kinase